MLRRSSVRGAWTYAACGGTWISYSALRPAGQNSLRTASHRVDLYVDTSAAGAFAVAGLIPATTTISLCRGWNFVGNPSFRSGYTVASLKGEAAATDVLGFAPAPPGYTVGLSDATALVAGTAYWVKVGAPSIWIVPGQ